MNNINERRRENICILGIVFLGIFLRFLMISYGHNYDFESYQAVGEIAGKLHNVYANTSRYNYAPLFFIIQGICFRLSRYITVDQALTYRFMLVGILVLTDLLIALFLYTEYSVKAALLFLFNPISIFITGFHNQFDNMALLSILLSSLFYNTDEKINKKDFGFVALFSISLCLKHIMFIFPIWILLRKELPFRKKIMYAVVPPAIFLMSFVPFVIGNKVAFQGMLNNVFLYRSANNAPLLGEIYHILNLDPSYWFIVFAAIMILMGIGARRMRFSNSCLFYLLCLVCFSSAIANQYLAIPIAALCVMSSGVGLISYSIIGIFYLAASKDGLNIQKGFFCYFTDQRVLTVLTVILLICIIKQLIKGTGDVAERG